MPASKLHSRIYTRSYNAIVGLLRSDLRVGERVPVQMELARRFNASQGTISCVMRELRKAGLVGRSKDQAGQVLLRKPGLSHLLPAPQDVSRREIVERGVVDMLLAGTLRPGAYFSELALARHFKVTTGTVREAMLHLGRLGVFTKAARKRWHFVELNREDLDDLMDLRLMIETYSLRRYFRRRAWNDPLFADLLGKMEGLGRNNPPVQFIDWELHRAILRAGGNRHLVEHFQFAAFTTQVQWIRNREKSVSARMPEIATNEHIRLLKAILAHDEKASLAWLTRHLETARRNLRDTF
jgi:DNA-binding GntR family transcriptional regulator